MNNNAPPLRPSKGDDGTEREGGRKDSRQERKTEKEGGGGDHI
jgi:hypothetical protein